MTAAGPFFGDGTTPERVGEQLATALAAILCDGLHRRRERVRPCSACQQAGVVLAKPVGQSLIFVRRARGGERGPRLLVQEDYEVIGRALEGLEIACRVRRAP